MQEPSTAEDDPAVTPSNETQALAPTDNSTNPQRVFIEILGDDAEID